MEFSSAELRTRHSENEEVGEDDYSLKLMVPLLFAVIDVQHSLILHK